MTNKYSFSEDDLAKIDKIITKYPEKQAALLPVLWVAQDKFGHLENEVQKLVASTLEVPLAHV
ncbi:NAD(P)H-dependent oxidoreductase subunit E, partial [Balneolaceae bacterium ANBcel3]|nr:NAD(P)H-dependent oxidoreductase subunit E [Balneolaceae bacterium ANBcel3]